MKILLAKQFLPVLAQAGGLAQGASKAMGIVMLIGFIFGTICVVGGGFAIRRGDTDSGKLSIIANSSSPYGHLGWTAVSRRRVARELSMTLRRHLAWKRISKKLRNRLWGAPRGHDG